MKVFIAGAIKIKCLKNIVVEKLDGIIEKKFEVLLGDAEGIDSLVQNYFKDKGYENIKIYSTNGQVRNNYGGWKVVSVFTKDEVKGRAFYTVKDDQMAYDTDIGFMIWNGESQGTFNNMINLLNKNKRVCLFLDNENKLLLLKKIEDLEKVVSGLDTKVKILFEKLKKKVNLLNQISEDNQMKLLY